VTTTVTASSQCARSAASFLGATHNTKINSTKKPTQITQFAASAASSRPCDASDSAASTT